MPRRTTVDLAYELAAACGLGLEPDRARLLVLRLTGDQALFVGRPQEVRHWLLGYRQRMHDELGS